MPGDGCCGPNCASAFLFGDEVFGLKLRRRMNMFMAKHWNRRYQYISQCSPDHPFEQKLKDEVISYEDPDELIKYLTSSEEAAFMWTHTEDLCIIADMYQIQIKVVTSKGIKDENPTVTWIYPEASLKEFAELKDVAIEFMVLFNEDNCHYNLVVNKNSDLAVLGSLSYRFNIGPLVTTNDSIDKKGRK